MKKIFWFILILFNSPRKIEDISISDRPKKLKGLILFLCRSVFVASFCAMSLSSLIAFDEVKNFFNGNANSFFGITVFSIAIIVFFICFTFLWIGEKKLRSIK
jgi:hypothetical protein